jgi:hypothetical protein
MRTLKQKEMIFLLVVHTVLLATFAFHGVHTQPLFLAALVLFLLILVGSSVYHLLLWRTIRRRSLKPFLRIVLFLAPVIVWSLWGFSRSMAPPPRHLRSPQVSPDKRFTMKMFDDEDHWIVCIDDQAGKRVYEDIPPIFEADYTLYRLWDSANRLWLYDPAGKAVYYVAETDAGWKRTLWDAAKANGLTPPAALYPEGDEHAPAGASAG